MRGFKTQKLTSWTIAEQHDLMCELLEIIQEDYFYHSVSDS